MCDYSQSDIDELKKKCISEYPFPFYEANEELCDELFNQMKEEYKDASFHCSNELGNAICLDNLSRTYYAAVLIGASRRMFYFNVQCIMCPNTNSLKLEQEKNAFMKEFELETIFKALRSDLSDCRRLV